MNEILPKGYNSREGDWSILDKSSTVSIPERTHIRADLKCVPKDQQGSGAAIAAPSNAAAVAEPSTAKGQITCHVCRIY